MALVVGSYAAPSAHKVHEKRHELPHGWQKTQRVHPKVVVPVRIGLAQSNMHRAEEFLMDVSHPDSPNYGNHWAHEKIAEVFAPRSVSLQLLESAYADRLESQQEND